MREYQDLENDLSVSPPVQRVGQAEPKHSASRGGGAT